MLDAETSAREPWLRERTLELRRGRISIQAVARPGSDFRITTPSHRITGAEMDADVSWKDSRLSVSVLRGDVAIEQGDAPAIRLRAGERLSPEGVIDRPAMEALTAWREGQLTFVDATLAEACAELNRYDGVRLVPDSGAAQLRISGTYALGRNARFAEAVTQLLPVRVSARPGGIELAKMDGE
jgi:transmembrane sensor